jgi:glycosyltransferase involved in cell wall biosynthesis
MATYNGAEHVDEQLESLAAQRRLPDELVVCDDGSTDATVERVRAFAARSPFRVHLRVNPRNLGFGDNFLQAARLCTGEVVAFSDQDDVWSPSKLERCAEALAAPGVVLAVHANEVADARLVPTGARFPDIIETRTAPPLTTDPWLPVPGMCMVLRRDLLSVDPSDRPPSHYLPGTMIHHDEWIYALARVTGAIAFLADPLGLYRQHGVNVTGAPDPRRSAAVRELLSTGRGYYDARREQAAAFARRFGALAAAEPDPGRRARYDAGAGAYRVLAHRLERRLVAYGADAGRATRLRSVGALARSGAYGAEAGGGFGAGAMLKDAAAALAPRQRPSTGSPT